MPDRRRSRRAHPEPPLRRRPGQRSAGRLSRTAVIPTLRALSPADRGRLETITRSVGLFRDDEVAVALEVFDAAVARSPDYEALAAEFGGSLAGWICWGPTPCTVGTWDLYWMAVDPGLQGSGVGTALLEGMESRLRGRARLVVVETAGRPDYLSTRRFYESRGYVAAARIADFYEPGDDLVVYTKRLT